MARPNGICRWCEEKAEPGKLFCDHLCEKLYNNFEASRGPWTRYGDQERAKRELISKKNSVRSG